MAEGVSSSTIEFFCSFVFGRFRTHPLLNCGGCSSGLPSFFCVSLLAILRCHSWFQWIGLGFGFYFAIKILLALVFCLFFVVWVGSIAFYGCSFFSAELYSTKITELAVNIALFFI